MRGLAFITGLSLALFAAAPLPQTPTYKLNSYGFGSGGVANGKTNTYSLEGTSGEIAGRRNTVSGTTASTNPGYVESQQANVPKVAALDNNSGVYYNKLHFVIDKQGNPTDAKYLVTIASPDFTTGTTQYVQPDGTLSSTLSSTQYQTYAAWGGASGSLITGLLPATTYAVRLKATQGKFTESAYGPAASQVTASPSITFSLATSGSSTPPFTVDLGTLGFPDFNTINTSAQTINTTLTTNGASGGNVYITGKNGGLKSANGNQINAVSSDLSTLTNGFGAQNSSITQTSGGPYSVTSPYNVAGTNVGIVSSTARSLYTSSNPIVAGAGTLVLKAKAAKTDRTATDYQETLTFVAAANF